MDFRFLPKYEFIIERDRGAYVLNISYSFLRNSSTRTYQVKDILGKNILDL